MLKKPIVMIIAFIFSTSALLAYYVFAAPYIRPGTGYGGIVFIPAFLILIPVSMASFIAMIASFFKKPIRSDVIVLLSVLTLALYIFGWPYLLKVLGL